MTSDKLSGATSNPRSGDLFLIAAVFAWGVNFPIAKYVLQYMDPVVFSATRYLAAACLLFGLLVFQGTRLRITRQELWLLVIIGLLGITLFQGGWAYGLSLTSASKASVLITTSPIFGTLIAAFRGNVPSTKAWIGIFLAFLGVIIVINNSLTSITIGIGSILGDLLIIAASFMWAVYTFVSEPIVSRRGPIFVTAWAMLFGAVVLTAVGVPSLLQQDWTAMPGISWLAWASTTVFGAALAFVWYCAGITRIGITRGMVYSYFIPVIAILTAVLFFDESMTMVQIFGALVVFSGVALTRAN